MSKRRGGENIWIAYSDMLTVLLMVFLLLALLFQVIVATSKIVNSSSSTDSGKKSPPSAETVVSRATTRQSVPVETVPREPKTASSTPVETVATDQQTPQAASVEPASKDQTNPLAEKMPASEARASGEPVKNQAKQTVQTAVNEGKLPVNETANAAEVTSPKKVEPQKPQSQTQTEEHPQDTKTMASSAATKFDEKGTEAGNSTLVAAKLPIVMVDTSVLQPRPGDLRMNIELSRTYLTNAQKEQVRAWAQKYRKDLATDKLRIFSVGRSVDLSTGDTLLMQVNRAVATMAVLQKEGAIIKNIRFDNLIVPDNKDDFIILRVENANDKNTQ
ncbi:hypothetical protein [uncultured Bartonella sp.]|uniref:hypothetical protein n=1 Tax=uncultured Bartonella sp. TaxID=104108 RepID=UPI002606F752|nr:hypothetical protein [uncultured Bartonella sp.]